MSDTQSSPSLAIQSASTNPPSSPNLLAAIAPSTAASELSSPPDTSTFHISTPTELLSIHNIRAQLLAHAEQLAEAASPSISSFQLSDVKKSFTPAVKYVCLQRLIRMADDIISSLDYSETSYTQDTGIRMVDSSFYSKWVEPATTDHAHRIGQGSQSNYLTIQQNNWYAMLAQTGLLHKQSTLLPSTSATDVVLDRIVSLAEKATNAHAVINNICLASVGVLWFACTTTSQRAELLESLHRRVTQAPPVDATESPDPEHDLSRIFQPDKSQDRTADHPFKLLTPILAATGLGSSILLKGNSLAKAKSPLHAMIADIVVPQYRPSFYQAQLNLRIQKCIFALLDSSGNFITHWNALQGWIARLPRDSSTTQLGRHLSIQYRSLGAIPPNHASTSTPSTPTDSQLPSPPPSKLILPSSPPPQPHSTQPAGSASTPVTPMGTTLQPNTLTAATSQDSSHQPVAPEPQSSATPEPDRRPTPSPTPQSPGPMMSKSGSPPPSPLDDHPPSPQQIIDQPLAPMTDVDITPQSRSSSDSTLPPPPINQNLLQNPLDLSSPRHSDVQFDGLSAHPPPPASHSNEATPFLMSAPQLTSVSHFAQPRKASIPPTPEAEAPAGQKLPVAPPQSSQPSIGDNRPTSPVPAPSSTVPSVIPPPEQSKSPTHSPQPESRLTTPPSSSPPSPKSSVQPHPMRLSPDSPNVRKSVRDRVPFNPSAPPKPLTAVLSAEATASSPATAKKRRANSNPTPDRPSKKPAIEDEAAEESYDSDDSYDSSDDEEPVLPFIGPIPMEPPSLAVDGLQIVRPPVLRNNTFQTERVEFHAVDYDADGQPKYIDGELQYRTLHADLRHSKLTASDKKWWTAILSRAIGPNNRPSGAPRSILPISPREWDEKVSKNPEEAAKLLRDRCVVRLAGGEYRGPPGFRLPPDPSPEPQSVPSTSSNEQISMSVVPVVLPSGSEKPTSASTSSGMTQKPITVEPANSSPTLAQPHSAPTSSAQSENPPNVQPANTAPSSSKPQTPDSPSVEIPTAAPQEPPPGSPEALAKQRQEELEAWGKQRQAEQAHAAKIRAALLYPGEAVINEVLRCLDLDPSTPREVNDMTRRNMKVRADQEGEKMIASECLARLHDHPATRAVNFLVLSSKHDPIPPEIRVFIHTQLAANDGFAFLSSDCGQASWLIAAHDGVVSRRHGDPNAACTRIRPVMGIKAWAVQTGDPISGKDEFKDSNPDLTGWECWILTPGETFDMPLASAHAVLTLTTSVCEGSFVYPYFQYTNALQALIEEHFYGLVLTNTSAPALTANFFRLWMHYHRIWSNYPFSRGPEDWPPNFPDEENFVSLALIIRFLDKLTPQLYIPPHAPNYLWPEGYVADRTRVQNSVQTWLTTLSEHPLHSSLKKSFEKREATIIKRLKSKPHKQQADLWEPSAVNRARETPDAYYSSAAQKDEIYAKYASRHRRWELKQAARRKSLPAKRESHPPPKSLSRSSQKRSRTQAELDSESGESEA
ncbi:hypothetical protein SISNIDRAFT_491902 [Sistotremastrum niveocremeum HHB9708]|uniref:JmjC domain-containing protein n=1 Tax=Sistotremastrum niveocremeum HHB9708 TaxID=1314777 RepID=A0A164M9L5_9AGAM|nr:hypothetical protein SISNIDRAFT_491902 [Sistotremastrum niveocremeum HHB9708]